MKKFITGSLLALTSVMANAEQFVIIFERDHIRYVFSALPIETNAKILEVELYSDDESYLYPSTTVKNQISYSDFLKEIKVSRHYFEKELISKVSGWKYIYKTTPKKGKKVDSSEYAILGLESNRKLRSGTATNPIKMTGILMPSMKYSIKVTHTNRAYGWCHNDGEKVTVKSDAYTLSYQVQCIIY